MYLLQLRPCKWSRNYSIQTPHNVLSQKRASIYVDIITSYRNMAMKISFSRIHLIIAQSLNKSHLYKCTCSISVHTDCFITSWTNITYLVTLECILGRMAGLIFPAFELQLRIFVSKKEFFNIIVVAMSCVSSLQHENIDQVGTIK